MVNVIKDDKGNLLKEPSEMFIVERPEGIMIEAGSFREAAAVICGDEYLDCECAETEWHMRLAAAKQIGLAILAEEEDSKVIVYDERIGKIPYSYTDPNPDYSIPENPELIRVEDDETFMLSLAKIRRIRLWQKTENDYQNILRIQDIDARIREELEIFKQNMTPIPLHKRLEQ